MPLNTLGDWDKGLWCRSPSSLLLSTPPLQSQQQEPAGLSQWFKTRLNYLLRSNHLGNHNQSQSCQYIRVHMLSKGICWENAWIQGWSAIDETRLQGQRQHWIDIWDGQFPYFLFEVCDKRSPVVQTNPENFSIVNLRDLEKVSMWVENILSIPSLFEHLKSDTASERSITLTCLPRKVEKKRARFWMKSWTSVSLVWS